MKKAKPLIPWEKKDDPSGTPVVSQGEGRRSTTPTNPSGVPVTSRAKDDEGTITAMGATAAQKRARIEEGKSRREAAFQRNNGIDETKAMLYMHDDNPAMIQVCRTGRNPTMRTLGRVHGISIAAMHEAMFRDDFRLGPIATKSMCADIHTKAYPEHRATVWFHVRQHSGVYSPKELAEKIGSAGPGWINYHEMPG